MLDPESERVRAEQVLEGERRAWHTFVSAPVDDLSAQGYVRSGEDRTWRFFAPDAEVLLSDVFADDHCFSLVRGEGEEAGLMGLAFEPVPGRLTPDVEGVLWLDGATSALRHLTFTYTNAGLEPPATAAIGAARGGRSPAGRHLAQHLELGLPRGLPPDKTSIQSVKESRWKSSALVCHVRDDDE